MEKKRSIRRLLTGSREVSLVIILVVLLIVVQFMSEGTFLTAENVAQIFRNNAVTMILAAGMLCVLLTGGIDISITSILAFSGMTIGLLLKYNIIQNTFLAFVIAAAIGTVCGLINGLIISRFHVPPIICTLGAMYIWRGLAYVISNNSWASGEDLSQFSDFGKFGGIGPYIILIVVFAVFFVVMKWTRFGRMIYAVGSNPEAAKVSGINVDRVLTMVYTLMGFLAGIAGALSVSIYASAQPNMQYGREMDVIAACVIGGVSLKGGRGTVVGTFLGAVFYAVIAKALPLVGLEAIWQNLIKGILILLVILLNVMARRTLDRENLERREM